MIECFERASNPELPADDRRRLLNFIVVGGGPTSIEFAGELNQFIKEDVKRWYPELYLEARVKIIEVGKSLMSTYALDIQDYVREKFLKDNIEIITELSVKDIRRNEKNQTLVELSNGQVEAFGFMVWSTGVKSLDFIKELKLPHDKTGRILTNSKLQVLDNPNIYAIGDCGIIENKPYPPIAQVADQQAGYLAKKVFNKKLMSAENCPDFHYLHRGSMAYIGRERAVVDTRNAFT